MVRLLRPSIEKLSEARDATGLWEELLSAVRHPHSPRMHQAADALVDLGDEGLEVLVEGIMSDPDASYFGWWYEQAFDRAKGPRAAELLARHLLAGPEKSRIAAARILASLGDEVAVEALAGALEDPNPSVRLFAAGRLAERHDPRSVEPLLDLVVNGPNAYAAVTGLGNSHDLRALPVLKALRTVATGSELSRNIDRAISKIEVAEENRRRREEAGLDEVERPEDAVVARLRTIRSSMQMIPLTHPAAASVSGPGVEHAREQVPIICRNIDDAVVALRTGVAPDGGPVSPWQVGRGLAALVADVSGPGVTGLMLTVLDAAGVAEFESQVAALREVATTLEGRRDAG